jgi:hypothetical protein
MIAARLAKVTFTAAAAAIVILAALSDASATIRITYTHKRIRITSTASTVPAPKRLGFPAASATVRITDDRGGKIEDYLTAFASVRDSSQRVIINGPCYSACTLMLGVVPRDRIRATSSAQLGFIPRRRKICSVGRSIAPRARRWCGIPILRTCAAGSCIAAASRPK